MRATRDWALPEADGGPSAIELAQILSSASRRLEEELRMALLSQAQARTREDRAWHSGALGAVRRVQLAIAEAMLAEEIMRAEAPSDG